MAFLVLAAAACGDLGTSSGSAAVLLHNPPSATITGTVFLDGAPISDWIVELTGWLDSQLSASTPLGTRTTDASGRYVFVLQPEAHHCGRMSARTVPVPSPAAPPRPVSPASGAHFPIQCGTTDSLDFHFETVP